MWTFIALIFGYFHHCHQPLPYKDLHGPMRSSVFLIFLAVFCNHFLPLSNRDFPGPIWSSKIIYQNFEHAFFMRPENWRPLILVTRILSICFVVPRNLSLLNLLLGNLCIYFYISSWAILTFSGILFPCMGWHLCTSSVSSPNKALCTQREPLQDSCFPLLAAICLLLLIPDPIRPFVTNVDLCCISIWLPSSLSSTPTQYGLIWTNEVLYVFDILGFFSHHF